MRETEIRFISRDDKPGTVSAIWHELPLKGDDGIWRHDDGAISIRESMEFLGIELEAGELAKIIIKRVS